MKSEHPLDAFNGTDRFNRHTLADPRNHLLLLLHVRSVRKLYRPLCRSLCDRNNHDSGTRSLSPQRTTLSEADWADLLHYAQRAATCLVAYQTWRQDEDGVLPAGYDPASIAAEAVLDLFKMLARPSDPAPHPLPSSAGLQPAVSPIANRQTVLQPFSPAFTRPVQRGSAAVQPIGNLRCRFAQPPALDLRELKTTLYRQVRRIVDRLRHRLENRLWRNAEDSGPAAPDDEDPLSVLDLAAASDPTPLDSLIQKEEVAELEATKKQFRAFLRKERLLQQLFNCYCHGILKPKAIARKLKLPTRSIQPLHKRLCRRGAQFAKTHSTTVAADVRRL